MRVPFQFQLGWCNPCVVLCTYNSIHLIIGFLFSHSTGQYYTVLALVRLSIRLHLMFSTFTNVCCLFHIHKVHHWLRLQLLHSSTCICLVETLQLYVPSFPHKSPTSFSPQLLSLAPMPDSLPHRFAFCRSRHRCGVRHHHHLLRALLQQHIIRLVGKYYRDDGYQEHSLEEGYKGTTFWSWPWGVLSFARGVDTFRATVDCNLSVIPEVAIVWIKM